MALTFTFTADASGSRDACTIPQSANYAGYKTLKIRPPQGHAWSYSYGATSAAAIAMGVDEQLTFVRGTGEFSGGETPIFCALDTGSDSFLGILE